MLGLEQGLDFRMAEFKSLISKCEPSKTGLKFGLESKSALKYYKCA